MESRKAVAALSALAQETRLAVYRMLVQQGPEGLAVGGIVSALALAPATLSFHLRELSRAGLVRARQQSRFIYYSADFGTMNALLGYLAENCCRASAACAAPQEPGYALPCASADGTLAEASPIKPVIHPKRRVA